MSQPNLKEIEWAISELLQQESSFSTYAHLADLYAVRDHFIEKENARMESNSLMQPLSARSSESEFMQMVDGKDPNDVLLIMDELMGTLKVVNPRVYDSVLRKIERL